MTPWVNFTKAFTSSFYARSSKKRKNSVKLSVSFYAFWDLRAQKLLLERWLNWHLDIYVRSFKCYRNRSYCSMDEMIAPVPKRRTRKTTDPITTKKRTRSDNQLFQKAGLFGNSRTNKHSAIKWSSFLKQWDNHLEASLSLLILLGLHLKNYSIKVVIWIFVD